MSKFRIREVHEADLDFVLNSFLKSYCKKFLSLNSDWVIDSRAFFSAQSRIVKSLLQSRTTLVACPLDDPATILGYIIGTDLPHGSIVDWVYVKQPLRKLGVAKGLAEELGVRADKPLLYTHYTPATIFLLRDRTALTSYVPPGASLEEI